MARAHEETGSLRFSRRESERVVVALLFSLLTHLGAWGGYSAGEKLGWWKHLHPPAWLEPAARKKPAAPPKLATKQTEPDTEPTTFVDVSRADADAPAQTKYYSDKNSRAANAETGNANVPKINGSQTDYAKTEDVPRLVKKTDETPKAASAPQPATAAQQTDKADNVPRLPNLMPTLPPPSPTPLVQTEKPEAPKTPGDLEQMTPPQRAFSPSATVPGPERPRTIAQALAQRQLPGQMMQQAGGVARPKFTSSLDARAVPFGDYDASIIEAVQQRWYDLLDKRRYADDRAGKVILRFKLETDGSVIEMQTLENTVGDFLGYLCQESIEEAAPFAKWPPDMIRVIGANYREVTFTFYYY
jgi:hypothetical protein